MNYIFFFNSSFQKYYVNSINSLLSMLKTNNKIFGLYSFSGNHSKNSNSLIENNIRL
ncbi:hypothetical protein GLOIN_2v1568033 [Rhizophagus irregularis DAOM 181602=DAOM 197198]|uniref:Uncharacterized protein n=1 Tax=Rhizophagus irregularis (strain DAOM 181602 / DAOM 197198 / MUCL 43194) TaxID=747089 RepID=A0A2P4QC81_RHIID|nr:hypothetical protein GLOIN_2v1568033 [Rhizophagus irregularis DAOM 181602=DAOM 197198]POG75224.1 hypothetical protein GLOIN_2v1568033 [Rhizophagus irregularis DAOM 181602=DAOM 197198]|eukprot:XP_025182090.1 hypothetical protein GLOIN_2v1568033 [Rhizophagus irregularis DAOM 181602=DAOM 197198]